MCNQLVNTSLIHVPAVFKCFTILSNATQSLHNAYFIYMYYIMLIAHLRICLFIIVPLHNFILYVNWNQNWFCSFREMVNEHGKWKFTYRSAILLMSILISMLYCKSFFIKIKMCTIFSKMRQFRKALLILIRYICINTVSVRCSCSSLTGQSARLRAPLTHFYAMYSILQSIYSV